MLHHAMRKISADFIFYADEDNVPYGVKQPEEVVEYVGEAMDFLVRAGADAIVVACNTATSVAVNAMRSRYDLPIIGMEPAAKKALDLDSTHRVLVTATPITVRGKKMQMLIEKVDKSHLVDSLPLPKLVEFAERQEFTSGAVYDYLAAELGKFDLAKYSALVLGCTHFNYFKDTFRKIMPENMHFVDGNEGTVNQLMRRLNLESTEVAARPKIDCYYSGRKVTSAAELTRINNYLTRLDAMQSLN